MFSTSSGSGAAEHACVVDLDVPHHVDLGAAECESSNTTQLAFSASRFRFQSRYRPPVLPASQACHVVAFLTWQPTAVDTHTQNLLSGMETEQRTSGITPAAKAGLQNTMELKHQMRLPLAKLLKLLRVGAGIRTEMQRHWLMRLEWPCREVWRAFRRQC